MSELIRIEDISYEVSGDSVVIEQGSQYTEVDRVQLHRIHLALLAGEMGLLKGEPDALRRVATLERRILALRKRIEALDDLLWSVPTSLPGSEPTTDCLHSQLLRQLADEFCADLPGADE